MNVYCVKDSSGQFCKIDADLIKVDNGLVSFYKEIPRSIIPHTITPVDNVLVAALKDPMLVMQPTPNNITPEEEAE